MFAAIGPDGAFGPFEGDASAEFVRDDQLHGIFVEAFEVELRRGIPEVIRRKNSFGIFDFQRAGPLGAHPPLGAIRVMAAPISDLSTGIIVDPAEIHVTPRRSVRRLGSRTEPEIVVETFRNGLRLLAIARLAKVRPAGGQTYVDRMQLANPAVANQFASAAKIGIGPLLA